MEEFCARTLSAEEFGAVAAHMARCETCLQTFREVFRRRRNYASFALDLSPEYWFKDDHLESGQVAAYVDDGLDEIEREMADVHLEICARCREDVSSFIEDRERPALGERINVAPRGPGARWEWLSGLITNWKPAFAVTVFVTFGIAALTLVFVKRGGVDYRRDDPTATASPSPTLNVAASPSPPAVNDVVVSLNDKGREVLLDSSGQVTGIAGIPPRIELAIKEVLLAKGVGKPRVLTRLDGVLAKLRAGETGKMPFKLLSPAGVVIAESRPTFRWAALDGATGYRVFIADLKGREAVVSEPLSANVSEWTPTKPLKRGRIYSWAVTATVNGKEVTSPGASGPEVKFKILEEEKARELRLLKKGRRSHLALGVYYANAGMVAEAEREFQALANENPSSPIATKLLRTVRSWR